MFTLEEEEEAVLVSVTRLLSVSPLSSFCVACLSHQLLIIFKTTQTPRVWGPRDLCRVRGILADRARPRSGQKGGWGWGGGGGGKGQGGRRGGGGGRQEGSEVRYGRLDR